MKTFIVVKSDENRSYSTLKHISEITGVHKRDEFRTIDLETKLSSRSYRILHKLDVREFWPFLLVNSH